jgi:hypothetical protein
MLQASLDRVNVFLDIVRGLIDMAGLTRHGNKLPNTYMLSMHINRPPKTLLMLLRHAKSISGQSKSLFMYTKRLNRHGRTHNVWQQAPNTCSQRIFTGPQDIINAPYTW